MSSGSSSYPARLRIWQQCWSQPQPEQATEDSNSQREDAWAETLPAGLHHPVAGDPCTRLWNTPFMSVIHEHLRSLNLSYFMFDLKRLNDSLGIQLEHTLIAFLNVEERIGRQTEQKLP